MLRAWQADIKTNEDSNDVDALAFDLKNLCAQSKMGSFATRANRHDMLQAVARDIKSLGYHLPGAKSLKPKHVQGLVTLWQSQGLKDGTIANRLSAVRWWAEKVNKKSVMLRHNADYGVAPVRRMEKRAQKLDREKLTKIDDPYIAMSLELQAAFGLRREEAIKFNPSYADQGNGIQLRGSWAKGGRPRFVPITHQRQREVLDRAHALAGSCALIPQGRNYIEHLKAYEYQTLRVGLRNTHGLRHGWAQWRYKQLSGGMDCPAKGGPDPKTLRGREWEIDQDARRQLSQELGHNRIQITKTYLGG